MNIAQSVQQHRRLLAACALSAVIGGGLVYLACVPGAATERVIVELADGRHIDALHAPPEQFSWQRQPLPVFPMPPYARHLEGVKIVLDPGHGGRADRKNWKRGPTGLREAEVNLRVAQFLREFLVAAGADVRLTRETDVYLAEKDADDLRLRAEVANKFGADLFISLHHNAAESPKANYTAVFYHGEPDHSPASLAAGRWVLSGLQDAMRLEQQLDCGLQSDYVIYPPPKNDGFAVLRHARVPAILTESSFHSNPDEEQRLRDPLYNRREAYGVFLGLARWAEAGLPRVSLLMPTDGRIEAGQALLLKVDDGLSGRGGMGASQSKIPLDSIIVRFNGQSIGADYDAKQRSLAVALPRDTSQPGSNRLYVNFQNIFGQPVLHPWIELRY